MPGQSRKTKWSDEYSSVAPLPVLFLGDVGTMVLFVLSGISGYQCNSYFLPLELTTGLS
jgi:hypothetical protein